MTSREQTRGSAATSLKQTQELAFPVFKMGILSIRFFGEDCVKLVLCVEKEYSCQVLGIKLLHKK